MAGPPGAAHSSDYTMWRRNEYASNGLREFVERGEAWALMKEVEAAGEKLQSVHAVFSAPAVPSGTGQTALELEVHPRHTLVSTVCVYVHMCMYVCASACVTGVTPQAPWWLSPCLYPGVLRGTHCPQPRLVRGCGQPGPVRGKPLEGAGGSRPLPT